MSDKLLARLGDIPGVAAVEVDTEDLGAGIRVRLAEGADEGEVLERVRALLVAYGVRSQDQPRLKVGSARLGVEEELPVGVKVTPIRGGARIEVSGRKVRSSRVVHPQPLALAQGLADAWCQVSGRPPVEIVSVSLDSTGLLTVVAAHPDLQRVGRARIAGGRERALGLAVGRALGLLDPNGVDEANLAPAAW